MFTCNIAHLKTAFDVQQDWFRALTLRYWVASQYAQLELMRGFGTQKSLCLLPSVLSTVLSFDDVASKNSCHVSYQTHHLFPSHFFRKACPSASSFVIFLIPFSFTSSFRKISKKKKDLANTEALFGRSGIIQSLNWYIYTFAQVLSTTLKIIVYVSTLGHQHHSHIRRVFLPSI